MLYSFQRSRCGYLRPLLSFLFLQGLFFIVVEYFIFILVVWDFFLLALFVDVFNDLGSNVRAIVRGVFGPSSGGPDWHANRGARGGSCCGAG